MQQITHRAGDVGWAGAARRRGGGFTLIELLVVIAIIGILSALLFPVIGSAINSGRTTASISNLKQIHMLVMNYTTDRNGEYPISIENADLFWRRVIWEHTYGGFAGGPEEVMSAMQNGEYARIMWCPVMTRKHGQEQHPGGRGSYALNGYFSPPTWRLGGYRYEGEATLIGNKEPYIMGGTVLESNPKFGTFEHNQSTAYPYSTAWMSMAYEYGRGDAGIGLFIDGHVEQIPKETGVEMDSIYRDVATLE